MKPLYFIRTTNDQWRGCRNRDGFYRSRNFDDTGRRIHESVNDALEAFQEAVSLGDTKSQPIEIVKVFIPNQ